MLKPAVNATAMDEIDAAELQQAVSEATWRRRCRWTVELHELVLSALNAVVVVGAVAGDNDVIELLLRLLLQWSKRCASWLLLMLLLEPESLC